MHFPNFDPTKDRNAIVAKTDCPVCDFKDSSTSNAKILNIGLLRCPRCGLININEQLRSDRAFKPTSLIRQLVQSVAPILDYLGTGDTRESWQTLNLWSSKMLLISRRIDGHIVRLDFIVNYESDCQIANATRINDADAAGIPYNPQKYLSIPPGIAALFEKLAAEQFGLFGKTQPACDTTWIKGNLDWKTRDQYDVRGIRVLVSWR
jgi:hypothetical protein